ncbi:MULTISPECIES: glycosyltransferase [unclassified Chelatococcus]|uniref:glycosyltransferase n=1 Tax=unclassified Chelatococcus TaxID=2638111 RepID=UPI001BCC6ECA|nr:MULTISPECIES: glycosyltransferase [unclassified Chelatococcus]CAH1648877.1 Glycosyl transferase family 2 [Hyphomicrobiales bacterium]MBS7739522.1 glycosyltransferase [Chelatococcus sp. HY11]MBX3543891.1 glycosyltransferase [Chelatococcus sp.]MCO5075941.1 glycosyltransferase [Chelatococcus sp.]CAH1667935.1 Glycosyl transferase family 2 [Hyphomicrobiales bacterium]
MGILAFVTFELAPFTPGGIGRVLHNMLLSMSDEDRNRSLVILVDADGATDGFAELFPGVGLVRVDTARHEPGSQARTLGAHVAPQTVYGHSPHHWRSVAVQQALAEAATRHAFDYVEFPDWGGLGFATIQEQRLRRFLDDAVIAVRLHNAHRGLLQAEARAISRSDLNLADIERKCLRDCDVVVGQLRPFADMTREIFALDAVDWERRLVIHTPPVLLDGREPARETIPPASNQSIRFTSKVQPVKRPDLFVRGVAGFMRRDSGYTGSAAFNAHAFEPDYRRYIDSLIPSDLRPRFDAAANPGDRQRQAMIAASTVVVPSDIESFCLAAYEASLLGARVVLNGANPAFGPDTPWIDGENCVKFDGTALGLTNALERILSPSLHLRPLQPPTDPWPWENPSPVTARDAATREPLVSVVIPHFNLGAYLAETIRSVLDLSYDNLEIVVVDDASTDEHSRFMIGQLRRKEDPRLKVVALECNRGLANARNVGVAHAAGDYILTLDADDLLHPGFLSLAVDALERNPEHDFVVPQAGYFREADEIPLPGEPSNFIDYAIFTGEAVIAGLTENRFSTATAVFRKTLLQRFPYREELRAYEDWDLYLRLSQADVRCLVTTGVYFYYRRRAESMIARCEADTRTRPMLVHDMMRGGAAGSLHDRGRFLAICAAATAESEARQFKEQYQTVRLPESRFMRGALKAHGYWTRLPASVRLIAGGSVLLAWRGARGVVRIWYRLRHGFPRRSWPRLARTL